MRVAVIDSGIDPRNPYVAPVAGGVSFVGGDWADRIGHGTVVAATIREQAPDATLYAVRIFEDQLTTTADLLAAAVEWCIQQRMEIANVSVGTANPAHELILRPVIHRAQEAGLIIVAAHGFLLAAFLE